MFTYPGGFDPSAYPEPFASRYRTHLQHLKLKGLQPKTIDAYARTIRRMGEYFDHQIDALSSTQLTNYFSQLITSHSWSAVKLDLYGFKFYTLHVLGKPWTMPHFIKPPKVSRLPDIVTIEEAQALFAATHTLSYRVFYFTLYSMGLRLSEGLALRVADIDAVRHRVHIRDSKGNRDRFVPLPEVTLASCAGFGKHTTTLSCCSPIAMAAWPVPRALAHRWTAAACKRPCIKWLSRVG